MPKRVLVMNGIDVLTINLDTEIYIPNEEYDEDNIDPEYETEKEIPIEEYLEVMIKSNLYYDGIEDDVPWHWEYRD
jgi:hypothetical protein